MTVKIGILLLLGAGLCLAQPASVCNVSNAQINNYVLTAVGTGKNCQWKPATGGATPGGSNTQVQFNDGGVFGANSGFTFDKSTGNVAIGNTVLQPGGVILGTDISTPANPSAGTTKIYPKGGAWCSLSPAGVENCIGSGGAVPITSNAIPKGTGTSIAASGCAIDSSNNLSCPGSITSGSGGGTGAIDIAGATSGLGTITVASVAGSWAMKLPADTGTTTAHFVLENTDGAGQTSWVSPNTSVAIGGAVSSGTSGSVLYVNASGQLAQLNANFIFDPTNKNLFVGANSGGTNGGVRLGNILGDTGFPGIWFGQNTPSFSNYAFLNDPGTGTILNAASGLGVVLRVNNGQIMKVKSTNVQIGSAMDIIPGAADQEIFMGASDVSSESSSNFSIYKVNSGDLLLNVPTGHRVQFRVNNSEVGFTGTCAPTTTLAVLGGIITGCS